eukprot:CAMPEP_0174274868 /NCGR_PEP_ID=MMETSP0439-20130205/59508_1 /TAXON_ID=0 /ORGANISM="Stereomyxa ramosa, Strain Chinc5" /LENGTH=301 /DNA_ID=CAMNT_0015366911 /DNA_START=166 /DNA_END=1071 /DNA_ORIENTATION=+
MIEAANILKQQNLVEPIVLLDEDQREHMEVKLHPGIRTLPASLREDKNGKEYGEYGEVLEGMYFRKKGKRLTPLHKASLLASHLIVAGLLVANGIADAAVAGSLANSADVIRAALTTLTDKGKSISSSFLMLTDKGNFTYGDCAVIVEPSSEQLAEIALATAETHRILTGEEPRVALLSFSTLESASHPAQKKVSKAAEILRNIAPHIISDGELQFDAAFVPSVAKKKAPNSPLNGRANVFIFPNICAGNIAYKITERLANATALGPLLQGPSKPYLDLSRGCSASDIVDVACIASVFAEG